MLKNIHPIFCQPPSAVRHRDPGVLLHNPPRYRFVLAKKSSTALIEENTIHNAALTIAGLRVVLPVIRPTRRNV